MFLPSPFPFLPSSDLQALSPKCGSSPLTFLRVHSHPIAGATAISCRDNSSSWEDLSKMQIEPPHSPAQNPSGAPPPLPPSSRTKTKAFIWASKALPQGTPDASLCVTLLIMMQSFGPWLPLSQETILMAPAMRGPSVMCFHRAMPFSPAWTCEWLLVHLLSFVFSCLFAFSLTRPEAALGFRICLFCSAIGQGAAWA